MGDSKAQPKAMAVIEDGICKIDYERKDYKVLTKEFKVLRIGKYGIQFFPKHPSGRTHKLISIIPLTGWITAPEEVERIMRERGMEL